MGVLTIAAGTKPISILEDAGEVRAVLETGCESDVRDAPAELSRIGEQPGGKVKPALQDPAEHRCLLRLEEQLEIPHGEAEGLGHCPRRQVGVSQVVGDITLCPQQLGLPWQRRPDPAGLLGQGGGEQLEHADPNLPADL